jgi:hypothetical protein
MKIDEKEQVKKKGRKRKKLKKKHTRNERKSLNYSLSLGSYTRLRVMNTMIFIIVVKHARVNIRLPYFYSIWRLPIFPMNSTIQIDNF